MQDKQAIHSALTKVKSSFDELREVFYNVSDLGSISEHISLPELVVVLKVLFKEFRDKANASNIEEMLQVGQLIILKVSDFEARARDELGSSKIVSSRLDMILTNIEAAEVYIAEALDVYQGIYGKDLRIKANVNGSEERERFEALASKLESLIEEHDFYSKDKNRTIGDLSSRLDELQQNLSSAEKIISEKESVIDTAFQNAEEELKSKMKAVDKLQGILAGKKMAGNFDESSSIEKNAADWLRIGSIVCMGIIALVVLYSLWETTTQDFNWQESLFRLIFSIVLSVPAAYLARESAKHRQQQYHYHQTSLDLKAITPYIASLPDDEQHRLKSEIAQRLFAPKNAGAVTPTQDPYPINAHEVLIALLNKLDFKQPAPAPAAVEAKESK